MQVSFVLGGVSPFIKQLLGHLQAEAMVCYVISTLSELLRFARQYPPVIVIEEGFAQMRLEELVRRIRQYATNPLAVLLSPDCGDPVRRLVLLEMGVDRILDVTRPDEATSHLLAMSRRHLRAWPTMKERIGRGSLVILPEKHVVEVRGQEVRMTKKEFRLLHYLVQGDRVVPKSELQQAIWGAALGGDSRTLDVHVSNIRQKIESDPRHPKLLLTVHGIGYTVAAGPQLK